MNYSILKKSYTGKPYKPTVKATVSKKLPKLAKGELTKSYKPPSVAFGTAKYFLPELAKNLKGVQEEIAKSGASVALTVSAPLTGKREIKIDPKDPQWIQTFQKAVFGEKPIKAIETRIAETELDIKAFGRQKGIKPIEKGALPLAALGVVGVIGLDFTGWGGGKQSAIKALSKINKVDDTIKLLKQINVSDDLAKAYAPKITKMTKTDDVLKAIDRIDELQKTTKVAQKLPELPKRTYKLAQDDKNVMSDFTDYVAKEYKPPAKIAKQLEIDASRIAERYGFKMPKTNQGLANEFSRILEKAKYKPIKPFVKVISKAEKILKTKKFRTENVAELSTKAKASIRETGKKVYKEFELPEENAFRYLQRQLQDKMNRLDITQKKIIKIGGKIDETSDAYLKQELYYGKAGNIIDKFDNDFVMPFLKKAKAKNINIDDLGEYLYAKHAPERNIQIAKINKNIPTGGSGMTDNQAKSILTKFEKQGKIKELESLASEFYENVTKKRLKILQEGGLEKADMLESLKKGYKSYVPLKGKEGVDRIGAVGQGFSITGKDVRRAFGRGTRAKNPFVQSILDHQSTLIRNEKNKVSKSFLKLVEDNPNPKLWEVESLKYSPRYNKTGEMISLDPKFKFADNVLQVRVDGKIKLITIHDKVLAQSMKNIGVERSIKLLYKVNDYLRGINTIFNPEFLITNFQRDLQTALINVGGEQSAKMAKNTAVNIPKAMKGIWRNLRKGDKTSEWAKTYQELKDAGGKTGFFDMKTIEEKVIQLEKNIRIYNSTKTTDKMRGVVKSIGDYVSDTNEVVEMAVRTSAYKEALANGFTKAKAASLAKNLTVNFNKKGNWGTMLNTLYLFANAGIQGSARVITALKYKAVRKIVGAITVGSFAINEMNRAINEEEYKKIEDHNKNSNLIFMMPNGNHLKIKLPYGFNIFKIIGDVANESVHKEIDTVEAGKRLIVALDDAYNPLSSATVAQFISPTIADPLVQISENKNWFGGPIRPSQPTFGAKKRESAMYWGSVRPQTKEITEWMNRVTGGSEIEKGFVDISPENIDHIVDFVAGGIGKFISNSIASGISVSRGEFPELKNIPFARKVIQKPSEYWVSTTIREIKDTSAVSELKEQEMDKLKTAIKSGLRDESIDTDKAVKTVKEVLRNQARIKAGRIYSKIRNATAEEKRKAILELNELEKKEFIKLLKKNIKE